MGWCSRSSYGTLRATLTPTKPILLSPVIGASLGMILFLARRYDQAAEVLKRAQEITPDHFLPHMRMGLLRIQQRTYYVRRSDP
jgi:hypothetical protein